MNVRPRPATFAPVASPDDPPCELLREIGAGAYGTVHLAREGGGLVAVKFCRRPADPAGAESFERERRGVRERLRLPPNDGLVRVLRLVEDPDGAWFRYSMELADSEDGSSDVENYRPKTLASVLDAEVALPLRDCIDLGLRLAGALRFLQSHHLVHRDVKPSNVLWVRGRPVLADVGLLRDVREAASLVGTPGYAPPEPPGTPEGDVYGLGRTLWRAATGRAPDEAALVPCAEADVDAPFYWRFLAVLQRACAADPARRYRSAKALRRDLLRLRAAVRIASVPRWLFGAAAAAILLAAGFGAATLLRPAAPPPEVPSPAAPAPAAPAPEVSEPASSEQAPMLPPEAAADIVEQFEKNFRGVSNFVERMMQPVPSDRNRDSGTTQADATPEPPVPSAKSRLPVFDIPVELQPTAPETLSRFKARMRLRLPERDADQVEALLALERLPGEDWPLAAWRQMDPQDRTAIEDALRRIPAFFEPETLDALRRGYRDLFAAVAARADAGVFGPGQAGGWAAKMAGVLDAATTNALASGDVEALLAAPPLPRAGAGRPAWTGTDDDLWRDFPMDWTGEDTLSGEHLVHGTCEADSLSFDFVRTGDVWRVSPSRFHAWVPWADIVKKPPPGKYHRRNLRRWCELFADFAAGARAEAEKPSTTASADRTRDERAGELVDAACHGIFRLADVPTEFGPDESRLLFEYQGYWNNERKKGDWKHAPHFEERPAPSTSDRNSRKGRTVSFDRFDKELYDSMLQDAE